MDYYFFSDSLVLDFTFPLMKLSFMGECDGLIVIIKAHAPGCIAGIIQS